MATVTELYFIISSKATLLCCKVVELVEGPCSLVTAALIFKQKSTYSPVISLLSP